MDRHGLRLAKSWRRPLYFGIFFLAALFAWAAYFGGNRLQQYHTDGVYGYLFWFPAAFYMALGLGGALFCGLHFLCFRANRWRESRSEPDTLRAWLYFSLARTSLGRWATLGRWETVYFSLAYCMAFAWAAFHVYTILDTTPVMAYCGSEKLLCKMTNPRSLSVFTFATLHVMGVFTLVFTVWSILALCVRNWCRSHARRDIG